MTGVVDPHLVLAWSEQFGFQVRLGFGGSSRHGDTPVVSAAVFVGASAYYNVGMAGDIPAGWYVWVRPACKAGGVGMVLNITGWLLLAASRGSRPAARNEGEPKPGGALTCPSLRLTSNLPRQSLEASCPSLSMRDPLLFVPEPLVSQHHVRLRSLGVKIKRHLGLMGIGAG